MQTYEVKFEASKKEALVLIEQIKKQIESMQAQNWCSVGDMEYAKNELAELANRCKG